MKKRDWRVEVRNLGITVALAGYFLPWLPHPAAGLSLIGLEMGEWTKFLPQVQAGQVAAGRLYFYLPPITLGLVLALQSVGWPNSRWQTWAMRLLAIGVSWLAFPALEEIRLETTRLAWIVLVIVVAGMSTVAGRWLRRPVVLGLMAGIALVGLILPAWAYLAMRPAISVLFGSAVGIGPGVWLNVVGHALVSYSAWGSSRPLGFTQP